MIKSKADTADYTSIFRSVLGTLIKEKRVSGHLSQDELAYRMGLGQPAIVEIEAGRRRLAIDEFCRLAVQLGEQPEDLFMELEDCWQVLFAED